MYSNASADNESSSVETDQPQPPTTEESTTTDTKGDEEGKEEKENDPTQTESTEKKEEIPQDTISTEPQNEAVKEESAAEGETPSADQEVQERNKGGESDPKKDVIVDSTDQAGGAEEGGAGREGEDKGEVAVGTVSQTQPTEQVLLHSLFLAIGLLPRQ